MNAADPYDPLAKLYRAERALIAAGGRGEAVGDELREVRNSIREILDHRAQAQVRERDGGRHR